MVFDPERGACVRSDPERRAQRLLRWYPASWRQRFGVEFGALIEDELSEHPHSASRTFDVIRKGLAARGVDLGITGQPIEPARRVSAGLASTSLVSVLFAAVAIHPWAWTVLTWNGWAPRRAGVVQTVTTGVMTVALLALVAVLSIGIIALAVSSLYRIVRRSQWRLALPVAGLSIGMVALGVSSNYLLRYTVARGGIVWGDPGTAMKQLAGAAYFEVTKITTTTLAPHVGWSYDLWRVVPVVSTALIGMSTAVLIRRMTIGSRRLRTVRITVVVLTSLMILVMASYLAWFLGADVRVFGGNDSFEAVAFIAMLIAGSVAIACARSSWRTGRLNVAD